ncbi:MAG: cyclic nucleotide-binding/CBS domain-containing protein [Deltaproteobacteria bacterium]|nr:cyclic nucleotide-binding/CBS domain-containing protein [Deltaproteobacteria bacterium]MBW2019484.1 cyclic nucleotide-binding/CBS domain-containing protein [Deltaproteobacteria bacterium]MBW2074321.1 cyclic nucleotide-binding/CBS domain-containing protein [Deltaproteobacteria bacterium]
MRKNHIKENELKAAVTFLKTVPPFSGLKDQDLRRLSESLSEGFYPKGTLIFSQDRTDIDALYLIKSGGVKLYLKDEENMEILKAYRGPGDYFGALGIIMETKAYLNVEAVEDTYCVLVPKKNFQDFLNANPGFSAFYLKSFCEKYIHAAYYELRKKRVSPKAETTLCLFSQNIGGIIKGTLHTCLPDETVQTASQKMAKYHIGSLLVKDRNGELKGIITDKDLRRKVVAKGISYDEPAKSIMSFPVKTEPAQAVCFDALLSMLKNRIHHLAVERQGDIIGVVTAHDILLLQGSSPIVLFREIAAQTEIEGLYPLSKKNRDVARALVQDGAKANNITRMITVLNDQILDRILTLLIEEMGSPPVPFCWMVLGSEGRKEQTFSTDQDNAIIYEDPDGPDQEKEAREYFVKFAQKAVGHLAACGYSLCKGDIMASNPKWNQPFSEWQKLFDHWIFSPDPQQVLHSTIFFDFRPAFGKMELAHRLRNHLVKRGLHEKIFIHHLARDCMAARPPLSSLFKNFMVDKDGKHKGHIDLKTKGLVPFVDFARLMSLDNGITATNTLERIESLKEQNFISKDLAARIRELYEFQMQLRLVHQLNMAENGKDPDNYINPSELTDIEKHTLKKAFLLIGEIQVFMGDYFHLNLG